MARPLKSMVPVARALAGNRREAARSRKQFAVVSLKHDGTLRQVLASDLDHTAFVTECEAQACQVRMTALNPGKVFIIVPLS